MSALHLLPIDSILSGMANSGRLQRLEQTFGRKPVYFLTACTAQRRRILATEAIHGTFVEYAIAGTQHGAFVGRYVIMPDHIHLFVALGPERIVLSAWVKSLKNHISKELRNRSEPSPHWQKGFFDHVMRSEESYNQKWLYVLQNPVRANLVSKTEDWLYQGEINALAFQQ